jgi:integrase
MLEKMSADSKINYEKDLEVLERKALEDIELINRKRILSLYSIRQFQSGACVGEWYVKIQGKKHKRKNREDLEQFIVDYHREQDKRSAITIENFAEDYLNSRKNTVALSTWKKDCTWYESYIKNAEIAQKPVDEITIKDANDFWEHCVKIHPKMKRKYWNNIVTTMNGIMGYIMLCGHHFKNPFEIFKPHKDLFETPKKKDDADVFTDDEAKRVCKLAREDTEKKGCLEPLGIIILFKTGLRVGEICALKWSDIENHGEKRYLHVQREMSEHVEVDTKKTTGYDILEHCKSEAGNRLIPLTDELESLFAEVRKKALKNRFPIDMDDYIFHRIRKGVVDISNRSGFNVRIRKYCTKAGMSVIKSLHDIRRTFITNLFNSGCPLKTVQYIAGHSSEEMTLKYLRRKADDDALDYMAKMAI